MQQICTSILQAVCSKSGSFVSFGRPRHRRNLNKLRLEPYQTHIITSCLTIEPQPHETIIVSILPTSQTVLVTRSHWVWSFLIQYRPIIAILQSCFIALRWIPCLRFDSPGDMGTITTPGSLQLRWLQEEHQGLDVEMSVVLVGSSNANLW